MTQFDRRLTQLEQNSPASFHPCEIVKVRADGTEELIRRFWTSHPVTRIVVTYGAKAGADR